MLALYTSAASATNNTGINATYYQIDEIPPTKNGDIYTICGSEIENNINRNFEGEPFAGCESDMLMVHYTGYITIPEHNTIRFWLAADDGGTMKIDTYEWGDWSDKGCTAIETETMTLPSDQPLRLDGWFYENGGGTCYMLAWDIDGTGWSIVPDSAFTFTASPSTTTTAVQPTTTTTEQPTTTSLLETTTTYASTTTSTATTTSITTPSTTQPTSTTSPTTTVVDTTTTAPTTLPPLPTTTQPLDAVLAEEISEAEAVAIATNSELLETATVEQAEQIFDAIDVDQLTDAEATAIVAAVQDAPDEIREAFEQEIDIYSGKTDNYIPLGSLVNVATRRVLVVSVAFTIATPIPPSRRSL